MEQKKKRWRPSLTAYRELEKQLAEAKEENRLLSKSNNYMEDELARVRNLNKRLEENLTEKMAEVTLLRSRSLWERIMNK